MTNNDKHHFLIGLGFVFFTLCLQCLYTGDLSFSSGRWRWLASIFPEEIGGAALCYGLVGAALVTGGLAGKYIDRKNTKYRN